MCRGQVALQHLARLATLQADDGRLADRFLDRDSGRPRRLITLGAETHQGLVDLLDQRRDVIDSDCVVADEGRDDLGRHCEKFSLGVCHGP